MEVKRLEASSMCNLEKAVNKLVAQGWEPIHTGPELRYITEKVYNHRTGIDNYYQFREVYSIEMVKDLTKTNQP